MRRFILIMPLATILCFPAFAQNKKQDTKHKTNVNSIPQKEQETKPPVLEKDKDEMVIDIATEPVRPAPVAVPNGTDIYTSVEQMPEFPGGIIAMRQYLGQQIKYPEAARINEIQGMVIVQFVVNTTGAIERIKVMRDIGGGCGEEAVRVVSEMPKWHPGKQNGKAVNTYFSLPVQFRLEDPEPAVPVVPK